MEISEGKNMTDYIHSRHRQYLVLVLRYWPSGRYWYWYWYWKSEFSGIGIGIGIDNPGFPGIGIGIGIDPGALPSIGIGIGVWQVLTQYQYLDLDEKFA